MDSLSRKNRWLKSLALAKPVVLEFVKNDSKWKLVHQSTNSELHIYNQDITATVKRQDVKATKGYSKKKKEYKIWKCTATFSADPSKIFLKLTDIQKASQWNKIIQKAEIKDKFDENTDLTWYQSSPKLSGMVSARDFVAIRRCEKLTENTYLISSIGVIDQKIPEIDKVVRGWNGPGGFYIEPHKKGTKITWILNADTRLKGLFLQSVIENTIASVTCEMIKSLKEQVEGKESS